MSKNTLTERKTNDEILEMFSVTRTCIQTTNNEIYCTITTTTTFTTAAFVVAIIVIVVVIIIIYDW